MQAGQIFKMYFGEVKGLMNFPMKMENAWKKFKRIPRLIKRFYWTRVFQLVCLNILLKDYLTDSLEWEDDKKRKQKKGEKVRVPKAKDSKGVIKNLFNKALHASREFRIFASRFYIKSLYREYFDSLKAAKLEEKFRQQADQIKEVDEVRLRGDFCGLTFW